LLTGKIKDSEKEKNGNREFHLDSNFGFVPYRRAQPM